MDALGLLSMLTSTSGLHVLTAGASVSAPADAQFAIVIVYPVKYAADSNAWTFPPQVGMCAKGQTILFSHPSAQYGVGTWSWGSNTVRFSSSGFTGNINIGSVIYLG